MLKSGQCTCGVGKYKNKKWKTKDWSLDLCPLNESVRKWLENSGSLRLHCSSVDSLCLSCRSFSSSVRSSKSWLASLSPFVRVFSTKLMPELGVALVCCRSGCWIAGWDWWVDWISEFKYSLGGLRWLDSAWSSFGGSVRSSSIVCWGSICCV